MVIRFLKLFSMKFTLLLAPLILFGTAVDAQTYQRTNYGLRSTINSMDVEIQFFGPSIVRVLKWPQGRTFSKENLTVTKVLQQTAFAVKQNGDELSLTSKTMNVNLNLKSGKISYSKRNGE